jgi:hypothetical protein
MNLTGTSDLMNITLEFNDCVGNPDSYRDAKTYLRQMGGGPATIFYSALKRTIHSFHS